MRGKGFLSPQQCRVTGILSKVSEDLFVVCDTAREPSVGNEIARCDEIVDLGDMRASRALESSRPEDVLEIMSRQCPASVQQGNRTPTVGSNRNIHCRTTGYKAI
mmetsp:Transcript_36412/g.58485  ORF Transcript_36412/g.58485 Transcript_36412/m.58485 type:complete len:105 (-) Transcript_36412:3915-4229(-)